MISSTKPFVKELLTKFKVIRVNYEPNSESTWTLQYKNYDIFNADEITRSLEEDEKLAGKEIEAQIELSTDKILKTDKQEKFFTYKEGEIIASGIYKDTIKSEINGEVYTSYLLDSVFPMKIFVIPEDANIGDWVIAYGLPSLTLPREKAPNWR